MVAPARHFAEQDMAMWLNIMCQGCVHGREEDGMAGVGCRVTLQAYAEPRRELPVWVAQPGAPFGVRCVEKRRRPPEPRAKRTELPGQQALAL